MESNQLNFLLDTISSVTLTINIISVIYGQYGQESNMDSDDTSMKLCFSNEFDSHMGIMYQIAYCIGNNDIAFCNGIIQAADTCNNVIELILEAKELEELVHDYKDGLNSSDTSDLNTNYKSCIDNNINGLVKMAFGYNYINFNILNVSPIVKLSGNSTNGTSWTTPFSAPFIDYYLIPRECSGVMYGLIDYCCCDYGNEPIGEMQNEYIGMLNTRIKYLNLSSDSDFNLTQLSTVSLTELNHVENEILYKTLLVCVVFHDNAYFNNITNDTNTNKQDASAIYNITSYFPAKLIEETFNKLVFKYPCQTESRLHSEDARNRSDYDSHYVQNITLDSILQMSVLLNLSNISNISNELDILSNISNISNIPNSKVLYW